MSVTWTPPPVKYVQWAANKPAVLSAVGSAAQVVFDSGYAYIVPTNGGGVILRAAGNEYIVIAPPPMKVLSAAGMRDQFPGSIP